MKKATQNIPKVPNLRFPGFVREWEESLIGKILKIGSGKDYKHLSEGEIPVFGTGGYMTSVNEHLFEGETVCIGRKGTINKPFYYHGKLWTVDTLFYTYSYQNVLPRFVFYLFERINWLKYNEASGVPSLSKKTIEQIEIFIPSISEQKKLADFHVHLDERIQTQNKIIRELKLLKTELNKQLLLNQLRFKQDDGSKYPDWRIEKLRNILSIPKKNKPIRIDKNKLLTVKLHLKGVLKNDNTDTLSFGATNYFIRKKGQFIYGKQNLFNGSFGLVPDELDGFLSSGDVPSLDINRSIIDGLYLLCFLGREPFYKRLEDLAIGSGSKRIHEETLLNVEIILPCIEEQSKIVNFLLSIDDKIKIEDRISKNYEKQKKYLLQNLFI